MAGRPPLPSAASSASASVDSSCAWMPAPDADADGEDSDAGLLAALAPDAPRLRHVLAPSVYAAPGALDVLLLRSITLVAYSTGAAVVIARGVDLAAIRVLEPPPRRMSLNDAAVASHPRSETVSEEGNKVEDERKASVFPCDEVCTAVAFRERDGAVAAAFGCRVVVYEGWGPLASSRKCLYHSKHVSAVLEFCGDHVACLAWTRDGASLVAVGTGARIWATCAVPPVLHAEHLSSRSEHFRVVLSMISSELPVRRMDIAALSPDGRFLAMAARHGCVGWVWQLKPLKDGATDERVVTPALPLTPSSERASGPARALEPRLRSVVSRTELTFGATGVAAMQWKPRGGGRQALMTVDRNGSLRLWAKTHRSYSSLQRSPPACPIGDFGSLSATPDYPSASYSSYSSPTSPRSQGPWMEEIARSPHAENSRRAGAAFIYWGGGGGVADDESDAAATTPAYRFVDHGSAPKPSRALHWIVRVASCDAGAWRVRGLDDQPHAEFARLEPGSGRALGVDSMDHYDYTSSDDPESSVSCHDGAESNGREWLVDAIVEATRAISPVPFTTSSTRRVALVKSYAISNGERRLRSPEPPEPPNIAAVYVLFVRNGSAHLGRFDMSPTSGSAPVCRALVGGGHASDVLGFCPTSVSCSGDCKNASSGSDGGASWLLSIGIGGDSCLWRADAASPSREPLILSALLPGPHTAVSFAPSGLIKGSESGSVVSILGVDAISGSLHLYRFSIQRQRRTCSSVQTVDFVNRVASFSRGKNPTDDITVLATVPLSRSDSMESLGSTCIVLGITSRKRLVGWHVRCSSQSGEAHIEPIVLRSLGSPLGFVTAVDTATVPGTSARVIALGCANACIRMFELVNDGADGERFAQSGHDEDAQLFEDNCTDDTGDDGLVRLREVSVLSDCELAGHTITHIAVMGEGDRVAITRDDGMLMIWERNSSVERSWNIVFEMDCDVVSPAHTLNPLQCGGLSFGRNSAGRATLYCSRRGGPIEIFSKFHGVTWERTSQVGVGTLRGGPIVHIGLGILISSVGRTVLAWDSDPAVVPKVAGSSSYAPCSVFLAHLLSGGHAWQVVTALMKLAEQVDRLVNQTLSEETQRGGGIVPTPPDLDVMLSASESAPRISWEGSDPGMPLQPPGDTKAFSNALPGMAAVSGRGVSRNLFLELMANSEAKIASDTPLRLRNESQVESPGDTDNELDKLAKLSQRLRHLRLAGLTDVERLALAALARAASSVRNLVLSLDAPGARYALTASYFLESSSSHPVPLAMVAAAVQSSAKDVLLNHFLTTCDSFKTPLSKAATMSSAASNSKSLWDVLRRLGVGWWVLSSGDARTLFDRIARSEFNRTRDPDTVAFWYIALGRAKMLAALYSTQQNKRMSGFLNRDFNQSENRTAAAKNAYALISKDRALLAAAFFLLAGDSNGALSLLRSRMKDEQLAVLLARVITDEDNLRTTLTYCLESEGAQRDHHLSAIVLWLLDRHEEALGALVRRNVAPSEAAICTEFELVLGAGIPPAATVLGHVTVLVNRPALARRDTALKVLALSRERALRALYADCSALIALRVAVELSGMDLVQSGNRDASILIPRYCVRDERRRSGNDTSKPQRQFIMNHLRSCTSEVLRERATFAVTAVRQGVSDQSVLSLIACDLDALNRAHVDGEAVTMAACAAAAKLSREDDIDSACAVSLASCLFASQTGLTGYSRVASDKLEDVVFLAAARSAFRSLCAVSPLHVPNASSKELSNLLAKSQNAISLLSACESAIGVSRCRRLVSIMIDATLPLCLSLSYIRGDWIGLSNVLQSCDQTTFQMAGHTVPSGINGIPDTDNGKDGPEPRRYLGGGVALDALSLESLRHISSNPAILGISPRLGHRRRQRLAPSMALLDAEGISSSAVPDEASSTAATALSFSNALDTIYGHPTLSSALGSAVVSYLASHHASRAAERVKLHWSSPDVTARDCLRKVTNLSRLLEVSETLEHVAADAVAGWIPLYQLGRSSALKDRSVSKGAAGAFVDLWSALGSLPEFAPTLSEAATVAAAELAAAAAKQASVREQNNTLSSRRTGGLAQSRAKSSSLGSIAHNAIFDTTSADSLFGAYPVRFSAAASGPWSGRGRYARLYSEQQALFRTLCISSSDPPAVIVATPRGIQEIVPSSYTAMPAGFRAHYFSKYQKQDRSNSKSTGSGRHDPRRVKAEECDYASVDFGGSLDLLETTFGEGPYIPIDMNADPALIPEGSRRARYSTPGRNPVWRHQVESTALAAHPMRRRFVSGDNYGVLRLWDFGDPVALTELRSPHIGRVSSVKYSAYGNAIASAHTSGHLSIWSDPDHASVGSASRSTSTGNRNSNVITAFQGHASDVVFLDEKFVIAAVGDHSSPPAAGNSLRVFDTREPDSAFEPSWSTRVHSGGEARCLALLEDRIRIVTGGFDGTLSIVDLRMSRSSTSGGAKQAHVAEIAAHSDMVTCLAMESPRERALVSGCRNGDIMIWDSRTLLQLDVIAGAHTPRRHFWSGDGIGGLVGLYGTQAVALTDRSLISCGGDGIVKIWGPGWSTKDLDVL